MSTLDEVIWHRIVWDQFQVDALLDDGSIVWIFIHNKSVSILSIAGCQRLGDILLGRGQWCDRLVQ